MRFLLIFMSLFLFNTSLFAQDKVSDLKPKTHLSNLKIGILFVQIPRIESEKIEIYEQLNSKRGRRVAKKTLAENENIRKDIKNAFSTNYDFSKFYFVEANDTKKLLNGNYQNILKDAEGNIVDFQINESLTDKEGNIIDIQFNGSRPLYLVSFGKATLPGDNTVYNGKGFLFRLINNGKLERLKSDIFFESYVRFLYVLRGYKPLSGVIASLNKRFHRLESIW